MRIVIRAGGTGTRLWPMSRNRNPKQFQKVVGDKSMLRTTYERVAPVLKNSDGLFVSINEALREKINIEIPEIRKRNIIVETDARNTGPAICLEVCYLSQFCHKNEVIASLPSDDYISDPEAFRDLLLMAEKFIDKYPDYILTPGIKPSYPDTGYSYLKAGKNLQEIGEETIYKVVDWVEKPSQDYCEELIKSGVYYYHTGMYIWKLETISGLWAKHQPKMFETCTEIARLMAKRGSIRKIRELYGQLEKNTVESAITHRVDKIAMSVSNRLGWSDLGKWHIIKKVLSGEKRDNLTKGKVMAFDSHNNLLYSTEGKKLMVANDIHDLVVVDTGDVLLVSSLKNSHEVKKAVDKLKEEGMIQYL